MDFSVEKYLNLILQVKQLIKEVMARRPALEPSRSFSIYLPNSLYQKLENQAGRGRINTFIKRVLEKELVGNEEQLILAHKRAAKNQKSKKDLAV